MTDGSRREPCRGEEDRAELGTRQKDQLRWNCSVPILAGAEVHV